MNPHLKSARYLHVGKSKDSTTFFEKSFSKKGIIGLSNATSDKAAKEILEKHAQNGLLFHFILVDVDEINDNQLRQLYRYVRTHDELANTPFILLEKEVDETPDAFELNTSTIEDWAEDPLSMIIKKPLIEDIFWKDLQKIFTEAFGEDGLPSIKRNHGGKFCLYMMPGRIDDIVIKEIELIAKEVEKKYPGIMIFNFKNVQDINDSHLRSISGTLSLLKKDFGQVNSVGFGTKLKKKITTMGLNSIFDINGTIDGVLKKYKIKLPNRKKNTSENGVQIDVAAIKSFISAIVSTYGEMVGLNIRPEKPTKVEEFQGKDIEFAAIIEIDGPLFAGTLSQVFSRPVSDALFEHMSRKSQVKTTQEVVRFTDLMLADISDKAMQKLANGENGEVGLNSIVPKVIYGNANILKEFSGNNAGINIPISSNIGTFDFLINKKSS